MNANSNSKPLFKGDKVTVFQDPHTGNSMEGTATLVSKEEHPAEWVGNDKFERWKVRFNGEARQFSRVVCNRDRVK